MTISSLNIEQFNYSLPQDRIAQYPLEYRDMSKLLIYNQGKISQDDYYNLPAYIPGQSVLIFNNSRVIYARLLFQKETGANIEIFCIEPNEPAGYQQNFQCTNGVSWKCIIGNKKRWKKGELTKDIRIGEKDIQLNASYYHNEGNDVIINFSWNSTSVSFAEILESAGKIPIPPYLLRETEEIDQYRYQTIYSKIKGSVAAPTAGLHFTPRIFEQLDLNGIQYKEFTLHVGAGTFKPIVSSDITKHYMHEETFIINSGQIDFLIENIGKIIAVGTTSTRLLESIYYMGINCLKGRKSAIFHIRQWEPYEADTNISVHESFKALQNYFKRNDLDEIIVKTSIMILPGYQFKTIKGLVTNFHQPKSTLLLLIAAFIGDDWEKVYQYALDHEFRFLSYGDGSLLIP